MSIRSHRSDGQVACEITAGERHRIIADEPTATGGDDLGPNAHDLFDASLAACTSITLMLYARRKTWPLDDVRVTIERDNSREREGTYHLLRTIELVGALDAEQRTRLMEIADRCPIHRLMTHATIEIDTRAN